MDPGDYLVDKTGEPTDYRVEQLVATGQRHQIGRACSDADGRDVALRAILYDNEDDEQYITHRRAELKAQWRFLEDVSESPVAVEPVEWLELQSSPVDRSVEPVIVTELLDGPTLNEWVTERSPEGLGVEKALDLIAQLAEFLQLVHQQGWLWRDFDPRRFIVEKGGHLRAASPGAILRREGRHSGDDSAINPDYTAPEVRSQPDEPLRRPAADLYGVGALLSFLLTGEQPRRRVESPLSYTAHQRIRDREVPGLELLVARLLQPMAKKRLKSAEKLRSYCQVDDLPDRNEPRFDDCELPAPWEGPDIDNPDENRGLQSSISSGPLVSMRGERAAGGDEQIGIDWKLAALVALIVVVVTVAGVVVTV